MTSSFPAWSRCQRYPTPPVNTPARPPPIWGELDTSRLSRPRTHPRDPGLARLAPGVGGALGLWRSAAHYRDYQERERPEGDPCGSAGHQNDFKFYLGLLIFAWESLDCLLIYFCYFCTLWKPLFQYRALHLH